MRSPSRRLAFALAILVLFPLALPALAAETSGADVGLVPADRVVDDDLYAGAISVVILGTVDGDLIAAAAERVVIEGEVTGSVTALAPEVVVRGRVGGDVRTASGTLAIDGDVGGDIVTSSWTVRLGPGSKVGGEVLFWSRRVTASGTIQGTFRGSASRIELGGVVHGNVEVSTGHLTAAGLTVDGDLSYRSGREAEGLAQAVIGGTVVRRAELPPNIRVRAMAVMGRLIAVVLVAIVAVTVVWCWPLTTERAARRVRSLKSVLVGFGVMLSPLLVLGLGWLALRFAPPAAGLPLLAVLAPLFLGLVAILGLTALISTVPTAAAVGTAFFRRRGIHGATLGGALVLGLCWLVPWVGWLVPLITIPVGIGAWLTAPGGQADLATG